MRACMFACERECKCVYVCAYVFACAYVRVRGCVNVFVLVGERA